MWLTPERPHKSYQARGDCFKGVGSTLQAKKQVQTHEKSPKDGAYKLLEGIPIEECIFNIELKKRPLLHSSHINQSANSGHLCNYGYGFLVINLIFSGKPLNNYAGFIPLQIEWVFTL